MAGIVLNYDNSNFFFNPNSASIIAVNQLIEKYTNTQIDTMVFNVNAMRTSYDSKVWDTIWDGYNPDGGKYQPFLKNVPKDQLDGFYEWVHNAWSLNNAGVDVYAEWIRQCRINNISPVISMRMNDVHSVNNPKHTMHSSFWVQNPQLRRRQEPYMLWEDYALDYLNKEVQEYNFLLVEELVQRYDFDGLELDWMRFPFHFKSGFEQEGRAILTEFMKDVRNLLDSWEQKRGHKITLSARIPSRPWTAYRMGFDFIAWAKQNIVDLLVVTPFFNTIDNDIPIELWKELVENTGVKIAGGLEISLKAYPNSEFRQLNSLETVRGSACSLLNRGADKIYLFNYFGDEAVTGDNYNTMLSEIGDLFTLKGKARRHIVTYPDMVAPGESQHSLLPLQVKPDLYAQISIHIGQAEEIQTAKIILGSAENNKLTEKNCSVFLNGEKCVFEGEAVCNKPIPEGFAVAYKVPTISIKNGYNLVEVLSNIGFTICWAEIDLM